MTKGRLDGERAWDQLEESAEAWLPQVGLAGMVGTGGNGGWWGRAAGGQKGPTVDGALLR